MIISGATIAVFYFTLEETLFERPESAYEQPAIFGVVSPSSELKSDENEKNALGDPVKNSSDSSPPAELTHLDLSHEPRKSYWERIRLITPASNLIGSGFKQYFSRLFYTLRIFTFPAVWYSGLQWGSQDAWLTFYLTLEEDIWTLPPTNYSTSQSGVMNIPCLIGAVIGCFWGGYLSDRFVYWRASKRGGIAEAEDRLWMMYPCAIISPLGLLLFGIGTANNWSWPPCYIGLGLIGFGWGTAGDLSMAYLMDAYPEMVLEGMVGVSVINNTIGCIFTFVASIWIGDDRGPQLRDCFIEIAVLDFVFIMVTVPMMWWGKSCRRWTRERYLGFVRGRDNL